jgi:hypothetical protein
MVRYGAEKQVAPGQGEPTRLKQPPIPWPIDRRGVGG